MSIGTKATRVARSAHSCVWCGQRIGVGETYVGWAWFDGGKASTVRVHPECEAAWQSGLRGEHGTYPGDYEEIGFGEFNRGCLCERGRCECARPAVPAADD